MYRTYIILAVISILSLQTLPSFPCQRCKQDCGRASLSEVCRDFNIDGAKVDKVGRISSLADLKAAAQKIGLKAKLSYVPLDELDSVKGPYIAHLFGDHFVVVRNAGNMAVYDPASASASPGKPAAISNLTDLKASFSGEVLLLSKRGKLPEYFKPSGPAAVFDPYVVDFGEVFQGDDVLKTVTIRNVGSLDLVINEVRGTCGCQTALVGEKTVAPGKQTRIQVKLATSGRSGQQNLKFYVHTNSKDQPIAQIDLTGFIRPQNLMVYPSSLNFGLLRKDETVTREIRISDPYGKGLTVSDVKCSSSAVKLSVKKEGTMDSSEYVVTASVSEPMLKENLQAKITANTNYPRQKQLDIYITAVLDKQEVSLKNPDTPAAVTQNPATPVPELKVFLTGAAQGKELKHTVSLKTPADQPFNIIKTECPLEFIDVSVESSIGRESAEKETHVVITLLKTAPAGTISTNIMLHTTDPKQPVIRLNVYGIVTVSK